jgi:hypothetical protein
MKATKVILPFLFVTVLIVFSVQDVEAQCAMCKATIENNKDAGNYAEGLNKGILYLMTIPYLIFGVIGYLWYRNSKNDALKRKAK